MPLADKVVNIAPLGKVTERQNRHVAREHVPADRNGPTSETSVLAPIPEGEPSENSDPSASRTSMDMKCPAVFQSLNVSL